MFLLFTCFFLFRQNILLKSYASIFRLYRIIILYKIFKLPKQILDVEFKNDPT